MKVGADLRAACLWPRLAQVRKSLQRAEPFHPRTSTREFVLYAPEYFEALLLPRLLDRMRSVAPNIRFKVEMSLDELPVDEAARGTVDAIITVRRDQPEPKGLDLEVLCIDRYVGLIRRGHPFAGKSVTLKQYAGFSHVIPYAVVSHRSRVDDWLLRQQVVPSMVHRCMSYISAVGVLQSTNHMMVLPLQVAEFIAKGFDLRVVALPRDFTPFELCYLTHPNAQFDPAKQWLKSAIFEIAGDLTYTAQRSMHPQPPHRRSSMKRGRVVIRPEGTVAHTASPLESPSFYSRTFIP